MTTRVAGGGGGEYGACHYTLAGGVRVPRNLYFSPFAFPFSSHDSPPTLSFRLLSLFLFFMSSPVFLRSPVVRFTIFPCSRKCSLVFLSSRRCFFFFPRFQEYNSQSTCPRCIFILKISLSLLGLSTDGSDVARRSFRSFPRVSLERVTRLKRHAASTTTCRHDNTKSIQRALHS